ncbi:MAG: GNAT family N-acetyltransferase, partial [Solirubrobacteraceae bacterium]
MSRDWHKQALEDAALRDMPLHALRHTAAAAWLAAGNSLMYVQRQLGHARTGSPDSPPSRVSWHEMLRPSAEVTVAVAEAWQGRGIATALLERVAASARAADIKQLTARCLAGDD